MERTTTFELDFETCERARRARDVRFDGRFFTAVSSTGIFCRPVCPAPAPKTENVSYHPTAAACLEAGYRPCLRCRPEAAPGSPAWDGTAATVRRAEELIREGALDEGSVEELAAQVGVGARQLTRLFRQHLGASPVAVARAHRALFAKKLLTETAMSVTDAAMAAGFGSLRQFNDVFRRVYGLAPRDVRRAADAGNAPEGAVTLRLAYRPPYDWDVMLAFLGHRTVPGVETVRDGAYRRTFAFGEHTGRLTVRHDAKGRCLLLTVRSDGPLPLSPVVERVRRVFDLDADPGPIHDTLRADALLAPLVDTRPGLRLPGAWDPFEYAVRAVLGQQVSVQAATTLAGRVALRFGVPLNSAGDSGLTHLFPDAAALAEADLDGIGLTRKRAATVLTLARAVRDGSVSFSRAQPLSQFVDSLIALPGIGPWTAHYLAMRGLSHPDAFPAADLGILKALARGDKRPTPKQAETRAEAWRPWRAYAALHLWHAPAKD